MAQSESYHHPLHSFNCADLQVCLIDTADELDLGVPADLWCIIGEYAAPTIKAVVYLPAGSMTWDGEFTSGDCSTYRQCRVVYKRTSVDDCIAVNQLYDNARSDADAVLVHASDGLEPVHAMTPTEAMLGTSDSYRRVALEDFESSPYVHNCLEMLSRNHALFEEYVAKLTAGLAGRALPEMATIVAIKGHKLWQIYEELLFVEQLAKEAGIVFKHYDDASESAKFDLAPKTHRLRVAATEPTFRETLLSTLAASIDDDTDDDELPPTTTI